MRSMKSRTTVVLVIAALAGCADATGPGVEPEIRNVADTFEFQVSKLSGYDRMLEYVWVSTGTTVNVNQSASFSGGGAHLTILDAAGTQVYSKELGENGTFASSSGQPGSWKLRVSFSDASGTANFRVQKRTP